MGDKNLVPSGLAYLADNIISKQNILGAAKETKARWAKDLKLPQTGETLFFAGCGYQYAGELDLLSSMARKADKSILGADRLVSLAGFQKKLGINPVSMISKTKGGDSAEPLKDAVKVLGKLGVKFGYLGSDEPCCGGLLYYTGLHHDFAKNAQITYSRLKSFGVKRLISVVPSCTYTLRNLFPPFIGGYDLEVKHFVEVILANLPSLKLRFPGETRVTYHDSCQMVRFLGMVEEPRQILRAIKGIDFVETEWTKGEWATCCGGGGGFEAVFPELSHILAVNRVKELLETGADIIVTHCPGCIMQLKSGLKELKVSGVKVLDLAQIVAMSLEA